MPNSADPDQTAPDQGLHCLQFPLHLLGKKIATEAESDQGLPYQGMS